MPFHISLQITLFKMKALEKIREISNKLSDCGIEAAEKEAEIIIRQGLGLN